MEREYLVVMFGGQYKSKRAVIKAESPMLAAQKLCSNICSDKDIMIRLREAEKNEYNNIFVTKLNGIRKTSKRYIVSSAPHERNHR